MVAKTVTKKRKAQQEEVAEDFSLNDLVLRGRVSQEAVEKELPSGDKVVEVSILWTLGHGVQKPDEQR
jgi:hypothetical protein